MYNITRFMGFLFSLKHNNMKTLTKISVITFCLSIVFNVNAQFFNTKNSGKTLIISGGATSDTELRFKSIFNSVDRLKVNKIIFDGGSNTIMTLKRLIDTLPNLDSVDMLTYHFCNSGGRTLLETVNGVPNTTIYDYYYYPQMYNTLDYLPNTKKDQYHRYVSSSLPMFIFKHRKLKYVRFGCDMGTLIIGFASFYKCDIGKVQIDSGMTLEYQSFYGCKIDTLLINGNCSNIYVKDTTKKSNVANGYPISTFNYYGIDKDSMNFQYAIDKSTVNVVKIISDKPISINIPIFGTINKLIIKDCNFKVVTPYFSFRTKRTACDLDTVIKTVYDTVYSDSVKLRTYNENKTAYSILYKYFLEKSAISSLQPFSIILKESNFHHIENVNQYEADSIFYRYYIHRFKLDSIFDSMCSKYTVKYDSITTFQESTNTRYYTINRTNNLTISSPFNSYVTSNNTYNNYSKILHIDTSVIGNVLKPIDTVIITTKISTETKTIYTDYPIEGYSAVRFKLPIVVEPIEPIDTTISKPKPDTLTTDINDIDMSDCGISHISRPIIHIFDFNGKYINLHEICANNYYIVLTNRRSYKIQGWKIQQNLVNQGQ